MLQGRIVAKTEAVVSPDECIPNLPIKIPDTMKYPKVDAMINDAEKLHAPPRHIEWLHSIVRVFLALVVIANAVTPTAQLSALAPRPWARRASHSESAAKYPEKLSAEEFARLVNGLSEEGGFFRSDNFTSNETSYLHVVSKLHQLGASGGAYIGVGPEQNFTYIAKIRPKIAFIVDIRRQAIIQHLMFKAIFNMASTRAQFLSLLFSRSIPKNKLPKADAPVVDIVGAISDVQPDEHTYKKNLAEIRKEITDKFKVQLSEPDISSLEYVYRSFRTDGLEIGYRVDGRRADWFPTLRELILETDQTGKLGNFLASKEDYDFVRDMERKNLVIPVVGDFGGKKALAAIGEYLKKNGYTVTAFYVSNVEQYLFQGLVFPDFVENVRKLPIDEHSLFIRAYPNQRYMHPARIGRHMITTLLQQMSVFISDFDEGRYLSYYDLVSTHYIAGENPPR